jgi:two-component system response regulator PilR (NtrC family)
MVGKRNYFTNSRGQRWGLAINKMDVRGTWARILFGGWLLLESMLFLINYRALLPPEFNRLRDLGYLVHVTGFFMGSVLAWFAFTRGSMVKTVIVCAGLFVLGGLLETCQPLVSYRHFRFKDILANGLGIGAFLICRTVWEYVSGGREGVGAEERVLGRTTEGRGKKAEDGLRGAAILTKHGSKAMSTGRILVVDDDEAIRSLLNKYLVTLGYEVITAVDGQDALEKFIPGVFDCVITDLTMPKITGLELLKKIKMQDKKVFVIIITGYPSIDDAVHAINEGAYDYLAKPIHLEDIRIKVERALSTRKTEKSLKSMTGLLWGVILSIPIWLILGIVLGIVWK